MDILLDAHKSISGGYEKAIKTLGFNNNEPDKKNLNILKSLIN